VRWGASPEAVGLTAEKLTADPNTVLIYAYFGRADERNRTASLLITSELFHR
jgi:hypothetical protein